MREIVKVREDFELEGLEKYNYYDMGNCYQKYDNWGVQLFADKKTREITRVHPYSARTLPNDDELGDLVKDGVVVKEVVV